MVGHVDAIVEIGGKRYVVEIKSVNSNRWAKMTGPEEHHKIQAACYVKGCEKLLNGSKDVIFVYYSKDTSEIKEYIVTVTDKEYNTVKMKRDKITALMSDYNRKGEIPAPCYEDANKPPCRYCPWKAKCHSTLDREAWIASLKEKPRAIEAPQQADITPKPAAPAPPRRLPLRSV
jgi:CRISPR/Cas system-associated exonuclease Cas4 (RecB family)